MLDPYDRLQLVTELRPPDGFVFAGGIGTTFSLDLESLLIVPMSLVLCEFDSREDAVANPEALLEGLRRIAGNLQVLCHRGRIKRPRDNPLFSFLEDMVVEALPQTLGTAFHPKVWVLRYRSESQTLIRVLVLSRNLTFDRSWDTALILEGLVQPDRKHTVLKSRPMGQFLRALPGLAVAPSTALQESIESLVQDVLWTEFEPPEGYEGLEFWPLGVGATEPALFSAWHSRLMVISPFLSDLTSKRAKGMLDMLLHKRSGAQNVLISRADQLDALPAESLQALSETTRLYVLDDVAANGAQEDTPPVADTEALSGLHAKVYVVEDGAKVSILTGSANATVRGWGRGAPGNVEFMVELMGARRTAGIDALLGENLPNEIGSGGLLKVLKPYRAPEVPAASDTDAQRAEEMLDYARDTLARAAIHIEVEGTADERYSMTVCVPKLNVQGAVVLETWPTTLPNGRAIPFGGNNDAERLQFAALTIHALTPFWAFRITANVGDAHARVEFVLKLPAVGMPSGRNRAVLAALIDNSERFLRYLALLLVEDPSEPGSLKLRNTDTPSAATVDAGSEMACLLEDLVRAYSRSPDRIQRIRTLVEDLVSSGSQAVPPDFSEVWRAFERAGDK